MPRWPWAEREFRFDDPIAKSPDVLERFRGTPARLEESVREIPTGALTRRPRTGRTIQQNVAHLHRTEDLTSRRIAQFLAGEEALAPADMTHHGSQEADFNSKEIAALLAAFRDARLGMTRTLERLDETDWGRSAFHPRLRRMMRLMDLILFACEHDDYHLARIREIRLDLT